MTQMRLSRTGDAIDRTSASFALDACAGHRFGEGR
jgi:hypothetical protein